MKTKTLPRLNKKGLLSQMGGVFQTIAFTAIFGAVILIVLATMRADKANQLYAQFNYTLDNATAGISNTFAQLPLFGTILGLMLILGVVFLLVRGGNIGGGGGGIV